MNPFALTTLVLFSCTAINVANATQCSAPTDHTISAVVRVSDSQGVTASGVVVATDRVLTAAHAIREDADMRVAADGGPLRSAVVVAIDEWNDLALLSVDTRGIPTIELATASLGKGDVVWATGYPNNAAMHVSEGRYRKPRGDRVELTTWVDSGHSGGAVLRCEGGIHRLAGIVHGYIAKAKKGRYVNTGRSVSIALDSVAAFLSRSDS